VDSVEELAAWRDYLRHHGHDCTDVMDRGGFHSLYLRDPDGHIVEIASRTH
jgi:glyoxylase I family protein